MNITLMKEYKLIKDDELMTIDENGKLKCFEIGKICNVHNVENDMVTAYWTDDIFKPIILSRDEFNELFELVKK